MCIVKGLPERENRPIVREVYTKVYSAIDEIKSAVDYLDHVEIVDNKLREIFNQK
jgi:hypothetical protein